MAGKCELCDGKVVNGRCVDCGMDYTRRKNRYHLNENCDDYDLNARKINDAYEATLRAKDETQKEKKKKEKPRINARASAKPNVQKKDPWNVRTLDAGERTAQQKPRKTMGGKTTGSRKISPIILIVALFFISLLGSLWEEYNDHRVESEYVYDDDVYEEPVYAEDLPDLPETGHSVDFDLSVYGCYIAGVDIPAGTYAFTGIGDEYSASIVVYQPQYDLYESYYLDNGEYVENVRLYDGARLRLCAGAAINCMSDNAQTDDMYGWDGAEGVYAVLAAEEDEELIYMVGEDISPGRYTVCYEGEGTSVLGVDVQSGHYLEYVSLSSAEYSPESAQYQGMVLETGDEICIRKYGSDDAFAEFVPQTESTGYAEE